MPGFGLTIDFSQIWGGNWILAGGGGETPRMAHELGLTVGLGLVQATYVCIALVCISQFIHVLYVHHPMCACACVYVCTYISMCPHLQME